MHKYVSFGWTVIGQFFVRLLVREAMLYFKKNKRYKAIGTVPLGHLILGMYTKLLQMTWSIDVGKIIALYIVDSAHKPLKN